MEMTIETLQYIEKHNELHSNIISRLERKENYVTWLIIGAIQVAVVLEEEKELLSHYIAFDKLVKTLHTCYSRDLKHLLESVSETDQTDLMQWSSYIEDVYKPKDGDDRSLDLDFGRSLGIERLGCCEKSEENTIPEDESSISLDGDAFKDGEDGAAKVEAGTEGDDQKDDQKETVAEKDERSERKEGSDKKEERKDVSGPEDFDDTELDSDAEDTGEGAEDREQELMNMPSLQSVMSDLGHLKQGRRVMVHPLKVLELAHPNVLETIQQASCEEIKLHFVRPQNNPEDWSGFLLMHFCSTRAAKEAVESLKAVRDDLTIKSEEGAAYANRTMEQWIRDEKGQKRWTDTLLWIKNISENVTEEQLKDVFCDAEDIVMRVDKDKDKKKDDQKKTKEAYIVYRTKDAAYAAAKEYSTQTIELDEEVLKIYKYHVPQDQTPRGLLKLKERRLVLKYMKLLTDRIEGGNDEGSESKVPDWCSKDALVKEVVPMIPFNIDDRMCCRQGREHLDSNHSQRDHDSDREDQRYKGHFERESFYCEEHLVVPDHEDREPWDQSYDRVRPEEAAGKLFQGPDFYDDYWTVDDFGQGNLGYQGIPKPSNWKRERSWEDWEYRCDHCLEADYRAHHEALLPQPAPEVRVQSPVRPPVKPVVGPPPVELGVRLLDYSACYEALLPPHHDLHRTSGSHHLCQLQ